MLTIWCDRLQGTALSLSSAICDGYQLKSFLPGGYHIPGELREQVIILVKL